MSQSSSSRTTGSVHETKSLIPAFPPSMEYRGKTLDSVWMPGQEENFNCHFLYDPNNNYYYSYYSPTSNLYPNNICRINDYYVQYYPYFVQQPQILKFGEDEDCYYQYGGLGHGLAHPSSSSFMYNPCYLTAPPTFHLPQFQYFQSRFSGIPGQGNIVAKDARAATRQESVSLPVDLISEVLRRLPAEDVLRCRVISKSWHSLTQEPQFIREHLKNKPRASDLGIISLSTFHIHPYYQLSIRYYFNGCHKFDMSDLYQEHCHRMSNSCNGLVCVYGERTTYVVNPSIREVLVLPETRNKAKASVALGHDFSTGEYKVVRLFCRRDNSTGCEIFHLGSHSWRSIRDAPCSIQYNLLPVVVNGAIHWLSRSDDKVDVLSYDIKEENFDVIEQPAGVKHEDCVHLAELAGHLCISVGATRRPHFKQYMWILQDYASFRWEKRIVNMKQNGGPKMYSAAGPVTTQDGREVWQVWHCGFSRFDFYDLKTGKFTVQLADRELYGRACAYKESLVSPIGIQQKNLQSRLHAVKRESRGVWGTKYVLS